ncbi:MAG: hypothetical protein E6G05_15100 [Actinobacteria bacterium]|nr:MAG: hypothetical protein E6G05_15100 [Actinomycetota bacterium]
MRRLIALAIVLGVIVLLLIVAQLVLPGIAAHRLRDRLSKSGQVIDIQVSAFPAIELLWHQADRVVVRLKSYRSNPGHLGSLLGQTADTGSLDASAGELDTGLVTLLLGVTADATLRAQNGALVVQPDVPILNFITLTVFNDPHVEVQGVAAADAPGGFALSANASLK